MNTLPPRLRTGAAVLAVSSLLIGCRKPEPPPPPASPATAPAEQTLNLPGSPPEPPAVRPPSASVPPDSSSGVAEKRPPVDRATKLAIERYFNETGRAPESWTELIAKKYLLAAPLDPTGQPINFKQFLFDMR